MLAWGVLASPAQERQPLPEKLPTLPEPVPTPAAPLAEDCHKPFCSVPKVLWYERDVPVHVLVPREVIREDKVPTLALGFRDEKRVVTDIVMKPIEVAREVCYTTLEPCVVTDPCTGHCSTVLKPVTRTRIQKDLNFVAVPVDRTEIVKVPFLRETDEIVARKTILLEYRAEMTKKGFAIGVPSEPAPQPRYLVPPPPPAACPHDDHH
jgi:hypothetical protein